jgi:hypothetical protein
MAKYNEILIGRWNRFLQKVTSIKGGAVASQLSSDIQPIISMFSGVEHRYLESWDRFGFSVALTAGATPGNIRIRNPGNSNIIAVIEALEIIVSAADTSTIVSVGVAPADLATVVSPAGSIGLDSRSQRVNSQLVFSRTSGAALTLLAQPWVIALLNTQSRQIINCENQEITILPGSALHVATGGNIGLTVSALWRERFLEDSERT